QNQIQTLKKRTLRLPYPNRLLQQPLSLLQQRRMFRRLLIKPKKALLDNFIVLRRWAKEFRNAAALETKVKSVIFFRKQVRKSHSPESALCRRTTQVRTNHCGWSCCAC